MVEFNTMQGEEIIEEVSVSILSVFISNPAPSLLTLGIYAYLVASNSGAAITDERVIIKEGGLLGSSTSEIRHDNVQGVTENGGNVVVSNAAGNEWEVPGDASTVRNAINRAQR